MLVQSPNSKIQPVSASINQQGHLTLGGLDTVSLAEQFGTPLWLMDEATIIESIRAYQEGLHEYPDALVLYAGKAFLCLAMCHLIAKQGMGLDVVSEGELYTAAKANFPAERIYMHGNNKQAQEIRAGLTYGAVNIVIDSESELHMVAQIAKDLRLETPVSLLIRVIPGVEPDTHHHIVTGHDESKFGVDLTQIPALVQKIIDYAPHVRLAGLHAHIGSQAHELEPYLENIDILVDCLLLLKKQFGLELPQLDIGGGLGVAYTDQDQTTSISQWSKGVASHLASTLRKHGLALPKLLVEPGRSIVATAGLTLYRAGHQKSLPSGINYLSLDGGMADNPRPITYQAKYTAAVASRMTAPFRTTPLTLVGKYCESGDIIIEETYIPAETGDLVAVFGTGAYNYSMASNYNRTGRPACVLVGDNSAEVIVERESNEDLLRHDRVPDRLR